MSVLITGASGLLGREILNQFTLKFTNDAVIGLGYTRSEGLVKCNLLDSDATKQLIMDIKPKLIIHSAAERRPDVAAKNPLQTNMLNVEVTRNLAMLASQLDAVFIYISTDYVFDGTSPPYQVTDTPNPVNEYGKSKYQGEIVAMQVNPLTIVLRVPVLYGRTRDRSESAINILIDTVMRLEPSVQDDYHVRYPTCTEDVARVLVDLSDKCLKERSLCGIFQFSSDEQLTKYQICLEIAHAFGKECKHISPDSNPPSQPAGLLILDNSLATRPKDCHLSTARLRDAGINVSWVSLREWLTKNIESI